MEYYYYYYYVPLMKPQCDQIWRKIATLCKMAKSMEFLIGLIQYLTVLNLLWLHFMIISQFSLYKMAKSYKKSGHLVTLRETNEWTRQ